MTTQYSLSDVLPKDATGNPFQAPVDISTSQLDFALLAGVGASTINAKRYAYTGVATHTQAGSLTTGDPGVAVLGYTGSPLSVTSNMQFLWLNRNGSVNTTPSDSYTILSSGSTAASADTAHSLFGTYNGLSNVAASVVLYTEVLAQTNDATLLPSVSINGNMGVVLSTSAVDYKELKPMQRTNASTLHIRNKTPGANTAVNWVIYRKDA